MRVIKELIPIMIILLLGLIGLYPQVRKERFNLIIEEIMIQDGLRRGDDGGWSIVKTKLITKPKPTRDSLKLNMQHNQLLAKYKQ